MYNLNSKEKAQGLVEFALVLPVLLLIVLGIVEGGRMLFISSAATMASREAARYGSAVGEGSGTTQFMDCAGMRLAATRLSAIAGISDANITISYDNGPGTSAFSNCPPSSPDDIVGGVDRVVVQLSVDYQSVVPLVNLPSFPISSVAARTIIKDITLGVPGSGGEGAGGEGAGAEGADAEGAGAEGAGAEGAGAEGGGIPTVVFTAGNQTVAESAGSATISVQLSEISGDNVTVPYVISGTATEGGGNDFSISPNPVIISAGNLTSAITVIINDDADVEVDETVIVTMGTPVNATKGSPDVHTLTITDNDNPGLPTVAFTSDSQSIDEGSGTTTVTLELSETSGSDVSVPYSIGGTATQGAGGDYTISASPAIITAGNLSTNITISVNDDGDQEASEGIVITMGSPSNAVKGSPDVHSATIIDNDTDTCEDVTAGTINKDSGNKEIWFNLTNNSGMTCRLTNLTVVSWPTGNNGSLKEIKEGNDDKQICCENGEEENSPAAFGPGDWKDDPVYRDWSGGESNKLRFLFDNNPKNPGNGYYFWTIRFDDGSSIQVSD